MAGDPFGTIQIGAATLKGNTELHNAIAQALNELVSDGTYGKILDQWGQSDLTIQK
jgi:polar amino acid transport system substrate-binding protein